MEIDVHDYVNKYIIHNNLQNKMKKEKKKQNGITRQFTGSLRFGRSTKIICLKIKEAQLFTTLTTDMQKIRIYRYTLGFGAAGG